ncbi:MAG: DUF3078 domain-containing protein [Candidatus Cloacimonetes bacterium]|nr:DUF3078 domain-containing protein [Candidatus Cloacimonadota bacterium]
MKRTLLLMFIMVVVMVSTVFGEGWNTSADVTLSINQNAYSDNWGGDEKGTINWVFNANFLAEKQLSSKMNNTNTLKLALGQTHSQFEDDNGDKAWAKPDKTTDLIDLESILRFTLGTFVDPFAGFRLESQFLDQSKVDSTKILNPMVLTESFGVARVWVKKENTEFTSRLGGAFKEYLNSHEGIDNTTDGGIEFVTEYRSPLANNKINFSSKLNVYKAMYYSEADAADAEGDDSWKAPRMNWENIFTTSITKLINVNLYVQMLYDERTIDEMQFKQTLALGLTYKLL